MTAWTIQGPQCPPLHRCRSRRPLLLSQHRWGALCVDVRSPRGWGFSTGRLPRPPGPRPDPTYAAPEAQTRCSPASVPAPRGALTPPSHRRHQREAGSSGPSPPRGRGTAAAAAGDFPSHQDFRRAPLGWPWRLLGSQGLGLRGGQGRRGPRPQSPHDLLAGGHRNPVPWAGTWLGRKGHRGLRSLRRNLPPPPATLPMDGAPGHRVGCVRCVGTGPPRGQSQPPGTALLSMLQWPLLAGTLPGQPSHRGPTCHLL